MNVYDGYSNSWNNGEFVPYLEEDWCCLVPAAIHHFINEAFCLQQQLNNQAKQENERESCVRAEEIEMQRKTPKMALFN